MAKKTYEQIIKRIENEGATAYQIASLINIELEKLGIDKIRPQMMYNYDRNGLIVKGEKNVTATRTFTMDETMKFVKEFVEKKIQKSKIQSEETESEECEGQMELIEV